MLSFLIFRFLLNGIYFYSLTCMGFNGCHGGVKRGQRHTLASCKVTKTFVGKLHAVMKMMRGMVLNKKLSFDSTRKRLMIESLLRPRRRVSTFGSLLMPSFHTLQARERIIEMAYTWGDWYALYHKYGQCFWETEEEKVVF